MTKEEQIAKENARGLELKRIKTAIKDKANTPLITRFFLTLQFYKIQYACSVDRTLMEDIIEEIENAFDLNEENEFGTKGTDKGEKILDGYDVFLPYLFLCSKASPYKYLLDPIIVPFEYTAKIMHFCMFGYQPRLLESMDFTTENEFIPDFVKFVNKTYIEDVLLDGISYEKTVTPEQLLLPKEEQYIRDVIFRRVLTSEGMFSVISTFLGKKGGEGINMLEEEERLYKNLKEDVHPYIAYIEKKVREQFALIPKEIEQRWNF